MSKFKDYVNQIYDFYRANGVEIDPLPKIRIDRTENDQYDPLISTGNYNPTDNTITLFVNNRQLKDILRSFCHELIHHNQHLTDSEFENINKEGKLSENEELEEMEADAYMRGNLMFRRWTEELKK